MKSTVFSRCQYVVIGCSAICKMFAVGTKPIAANTYMWNTSSASSPMALMNLPVFMFLPPRHLALKEFGLWHLLQIVQYAGHKSFWWYLCLWLHAVPECVCYQVVCLGNSVCVPGVISQVFTVSPELSMWPTTFICAIMVAQQISSTLWKEWG